VVDYIEIQAPPGRADMPFYVTADWAQRFPPEQIWKLRKQ
jgi:hypothetical protein